MSADKITVYVDNRPRHLFVGMNVKHALGTRMTQRVRKHLALVRDADGNLVDTDGALYDGERLYISAIDPTRFADEIKK